MLISICAGEGYPSASPTLGPTSVCLQTASSKTAIGQWQRQPSHPPWVWTVPLKSPLWQSLMSPPCRCGLIGFTLLTRSVPHASMLANACADHSLQHHSVIGFVLHSDTIIKLAASLYITLLLLLSVLCISILHRPPTKVAKDLRPSLI